MYEKIIFIGYDENGIPIFETINQHVEFCGAIYDEEGRYIPIYN